MADEHNPGYSEDTAKADATAAWEEQAAKLEELKAELENLKHSVSGITSATKTLASTSVEAVIGDIESTLQRNVFMSVGVAAVLGYIWGRTR